jgi:hypothetical protein
MDALRFDAAEHRYFVGDRELPSVTRILQDARLADFSAPWFTADVMERGTLVHAAIALDNEGALDYDALDPVLVGYVNGWRRYLDEAGATVLDFERPVCDLAAGYAGTLDAIVSERAQLRRPTLIDIKPALYPSVSIQTAAYARCAPMPHGYSLPFVRAAIVLPGDGTYKREPLDDRDDERVFLAAVTTFHWRSTHVVDRRRVA